MKTAILFFAFMFAMLFAAWNMANEGHSYIAIVAGFEAGVACIVAVIHLSKACWARVQL